MNTTLGQVLLALGALAVIGALVGLGIRYTEIVAVVVPDDTGDEKINPVDNSEIAPETA